MTKIGELTQDEHAVDSIVGDLLLVAITVAMSTMLVFAIAQIPTPTDSIHASLSSSISSGPDGVWGTGDETVSVRHGWGEPIPSASTRIVLTVDGTATEWSGPTLGGGFADGALEVGEQWSATAAMAVTSDVLFQVIGTGGGSQLIVGSTLTPGDDTSPLCGSDTNQPSVTLWQQVPGDIRRSTTGAVIVNATVVDDCAGVDETNVPRLWYSISAGAPGIYSDAGPLALIGTAKWQGTIPAADWQAQSGKTLFYYIDSIADLAGNAGQSAVQSDLIDASGSVVFPFNHTETFGTVSNWPNIQSDTDSGASALLREVDSGTGFTLVAQQFFNNVAPGSGHQLEMFYRARVDTFQVQVWDWVTSSWNSKPFPLDSFDFTSWSASIESDEISGGAGVGGEVHMRIIDNDPLAASAGSVQADYFRVVTL